MNRMPTVVTLRRGFALASSALLAVLVLATTGCPGAPTTDGVTGGSGADGGTGTGGPLSGRVVNITSNIRLSQLDPAVSVTYTVTGTPTSISGFFVPVADAGAVTPIGDRTILATNLPASGSNTRFSFDPTVSGAGFFRVGLVLTGTAGETEVFSAGTIQVEGPPVPFFIQPLDATTSITPGQSVFISFDAGDPDSRPEQIHWRLCFVGETDSRAVAADALGAQIAIGTGNTGSATLQTATIPPGNYTLCLSATDSGSSIASTVSSGRSDRIVTVFGPAVRILDPSAVLPPTLTFTKPGTAAVSLFRNQAFGLEFSTSIAEVGATATIELFYDDDKNINNGFIKTLEGADNLPSTLTTFPLPTDLPEGTWTIGGTVRTIGGISSPVTFYANGRVNVVRNPTLTVDEPNSILPVSPGEKVNIAWTTNAPADSGTVDVFAQRLGSGGGAGTPIQILTGQAISTRTATFSNETPGQYQIFVKLSFVDDTTQQASAPRVVRVSSLPPILWVGSIAATDPPFDGAIFGGVNFEDNAGTSLSTAGDLNGDGRDEIVIGSRYGKPFFQNPSGVGPGEAYVLFGGSGVKQPKGEFSLNSVGTETLPGVVFTGIRTPQATNDTDGMSSVGSIPDVDGDGSPELIFGFPNTDSRGHNVDPRQDGVIGPFSLSTLEREGQFKRGGVVIVSSTNRVLATPTPGAAIELDKVGQDFVSTCVRPDPNPAQGAPPFADDVHSAADLTDPNNPGCTGSCDTPASGGAVDAARFINFGFVKALSRDYFSTYVYPAALFGGLNRCGAEAQAFINDQCLRDIFPPVFHEYCNDFVATCEPFSPGLHGQDFNDSVTVMSNRGRPVTMEVRSRLSGFYPQDLAIDDQNQNTMPNDPLEPFGARIIGVGVGDLFGTSISPNAVGDTGVTDLIVSAPGRTARGILLGPTPPGCEDPPTCGGEINGLESSLGSAKTNADSGVGYLFRLRSLWTPDASGAVPPKPHQYIVGEASHSCDARGLRLIDNIDAIRIAGFTSDRISNIVGISDFNGDGRNDFAIGAPNAIGGRGRVYIAYRRQPSVEGDFVLEKLGKDPSDSERLAGMLVVADGNDAFGSALVSGIDLNGDGADDLVIGSPSASGGLGEVIVLFGATKLVSPVDGFSVGDLLTTIRTSDGQPVAARITGNSLDASGRFGFNVANAGDIDGDGLDDLLIAAPGASPRFDPDPTNTTDALTDAGLDLDFDGIKDDLRATAGLPAACVGANNELRSAGLVYIVFGKNRLDNLRTCSMSGKVCEVDADCDLVDETCGTSTSTINIDQLGTAQLKGMIIVGRCGGDRLGGGDAGDTIIGGISAKAGRGRSAGLASAGDVDGDGRDDILIGSILADPRRDVNTGVGVKNGGETYLIYGSVAR